MNGKMETVGTEHRGQKIQPGNPTQETKEASPGDYTEQYAYYATDDNITIANGGAGSTLSYDSTTWQSIQGINPPALSITATVFQNNADPTSLAYTYQGNIGSPVEIGFMVVIFASNPNSVSIYPVESTPTGIWVGTSNGGSEPGCLSSGPLNKSAKPDA